MKTILTLGLFLTMQFCFAQKTETTIEQFTIKSLKVECSSAEELKTINWESIEELISMNEDEDVIELQFGLHNKEEKSKVNGNFNFTVKGKKKDVKNLIKRAKKGVKGLKSVLNKIDEINEN